MVRCSEKGAGGLRPRDTKEGAWQKGCESNAGWQGWQPVNWVPKKSIVCHECGHGAKKQNPWHESADQRGAARRSALAGWGPRTHEDGGARGEPRRCAGLRPTGCVGERGSTVERRGKRFTIPLHKASRRVADTSNAVPVVTLCVAAWKIATARSTSGQSW